MQNFELTKHQVTEVNFRDNGRQKEGESREEKAQVY